MAIYNNNNGTLTTLASGSRVWIGTESAFNTAKNSIPNNTAIYITDDGDSPSEMRKYGTSGVTFASIVSGLGLTYPLYIRIDFISDDGTKMLSGFIYKPDENSNPSSSLILGSTSNVRFNYNTSLIVAYDSANSSNISGYYRIESIK